jgi:hypothetical protein
MVKAKSKVNIAGQIVWDEKGVYFMAARNFECRPLGEQWSVMRAAERAMNRIVMRLTDDLTDQNRSLRYEAHED